MSDADPIESLKTILVDRGTGVLEQPELVEALLQDYCPASKPDIYLLVSSLKEGVPQRLMAARTPTHREAVIGQLREQMQVNLGMQPQRAQWAVNAWLNALPPQSSEFSQPPPLLEPQPVPAMKFVPTEGLRVFIRKRSRRLMFHRGWFKKVEDELVERGVPRIEATKMLNEYCGKRQVGESAPARKQPVPFSWKGAFGRLGYLLVVCACAAIYIFVFRVHPFTLLVNAPAFASEAFHRAIAGNYVGALEIVGGGVLAFSAVFIFIGAWKRAFR